MQTNVGIGVLPSGFLPDAVPYAVLTPSLGDGPLPLCIFLHGGGGSRQTLIDCKPLFEQWWSDGSLSIRRSNLAIYIETGDRDFINVHDGAEFLHRILWNLDIAHEYRLTRGADHVGPTLIPRMRDAFLWLAPVLTSQPEPEDQAVTAWIEAGMSGPPPAVAPTSEACIRVIRAQLEPRRRQAAIDDPTTNRLFGVLP